MVQIHYEMSKNQVFYIIIWCTNIIIFYNENTEEENKL